MYLEVHNASYPKRVHGDPELPNFGVLLNLCPHHFTQNDQSRNGDIYWEERVFIGQPAVAFAQVRRAVCQRQLSFLFNGE